jgi:sortase (surface protein transpeptidase)
VEIPTITTRADLVPLGLNPDGSMEVPDFGLAGYYAEGPTPGDPGPAVIAAHVDSYQGPDVFFELRSLRPGDEILVHHADSSTSTFIVESTEQTPKDELPGDRIWNDTDEPVLRLVTCGGSFDRSTGHYRDNVIVYASQA